MKIAFTLPLLIVLLAGCAAMTSSMSPEQMAQHAKDKNAVVACGNGTGPWGKVTTVYVDTNKINDNNSVSVDSECKVSVTGTKAVPAPK
jgi:hypothetical protein